jgi:syntaxin 5
MNRTADFRTALERERGRRVGVSTVPRPADGLSTRVTNVRDRLWFAAKTLDAMTNLIDDANVLDENNEEIENLVLGLKRDFFDATEMIDVLERYRPQSSHLVTVTKALRRDLKALSDDFCDAMRARAEKVESAWARRKASQIGFRAATPQFFSTTYGGDEQEIPTPARDQILIEQQRERLGVVRNVETSVHEISQLFVRLNELIMADDLSIQRIGENTDAALTHMEQGSREIAKFYETVKGNKRLMISIFAVLLVAVLVFILIM